MEGLGEKIYLKYLDTDKMRGEVDIFLFPVLHWAWAIVHWLSESLIVSTDLTDVTLVSDDTYGEDE